MKAEAVSAIKALIPEGKVTQSTGQLVKVHTDSIHTPTLLAVAGCVKEHDLEVELKRSGTGITLIFSNYQ